MLHNSRPAPCERGVFPRRGGYLLDKRRQRSIFDLPKIKSHRRASYFKRMDSRLLGLQLRGDDNDMLPSTDCRESRQEQVLLTIDGPVRLDPSIVAECYRDHGESLRRFALGLVRDAQLAGDIVQTTFARFAERGHEVEAGKRRAWLYRVAYNESMLQRRRRARDERVLQRAVWSRETLCEPAFDNLVRGEEVDRVREAINALPPQLGQVVRMRIYEEKTFAVIAGELGIPLGTALGRMRTALQRLRQEFSDNLES